MSNIESRAARETPKAEGRNGKSKNIDAHGCGRDEHEEYTTKGAPSSPEGKKDTKLRH